ncbi:glycosyltransferase, partial [Candidatus Gracilibacteria bacterium]|nr:glycosyltransferase [Candidatus Gracilibacteria bacterium]
MPLPDRTAPYLSVVVPIYNEEESIPHLVERLSEALVDVPGGYEIITVDDGSRAPSVSPCCVDYRRPTIHLSGFVL